MKNEKFIPQLAVIPNVFSAHLLILVPKAQLERCAPYCAIGNWVPNCQLLYVMAP